MTATSLEKTAAQFAPETSVSSGAETASIRLSGQMIYAGVALGTAQVLSEYSISVPRFTISEEQRDSECQRLRAAINTVVQDLLELRDSLVSQPDSPPEAQAFVDLQCQIAKDESLLSETQQIINDRLVNAEWALAQRLEDLLRAFESIDDEYLAQRAEDVSHVIERVQRVLTNRRRPAELRRPQSREGLVILVARDLDPTDVLQLRRRRDRTCAGLIISNGSPNSHAAILARSLQIPTLINVSEASDLVADGDQLLLDADHGTVIVRPEPGLLPEAAERIRVRRETEERRRNLRGAPTVTKDGVLVSLMANISLPEDAVGAGQVGADGIGLFRSEFLFMNRPTLPSEDEQYESYLRVVRAMKGKPVTIRTADLGGDKTVADELAAQLEPDAEIASVTNPALGRRGIRLSLARPEFMLTQLRAILRAAARDAERVRVLLPMVSRPAEIREAQLLLARAAASLRDEDVPHADKLALGAMIEVPAAAIALPAFLRRLDFVSLGTNDLIQYTLAIDRQDPDVNDLYDPLHPAVLSLLAGSVRAAARAHKPISVCGEIAGDSIMAPLLVGLGLRELSMAPGRLLSVKEKILAMSCAKTRDFCARLRRARDPRALLAAAVSPRKAPRNPAPGRKRGSGTAR